MELFQPFLLSNHFSCLWDFPFKFELFTLFLYFLLFFQVLIYTSSFLILPSKMPTYTIFNCMRQTGRCCCCCCSTAVFLMCFINFFKQKSFTFHTHFLLCLLPFFIISLLKYTGTIACFTCYTNLAFLFSLHLLIHTYYHSYHYPRQKFKYIYFFILYVCVCLSV